MSSANHGSAQPIDEPSRRQRLKNRIQKVGQNVRKLNLARLIDDMERDQELADNLETVNNDASEEMKRKDMVRECVARCQQEMEDHLRSFLISHPQSTYEHWIHELHPDNVHQGKILEDLWTIDNRFYVESSDHRQLWNRQVPEKQVPARSYIHGCLDHGPPVDLLDDTNAMEALEDIDFSQTENVDF